MAMALIFEMNRVNGKGMRRPSVKAVVCDGYILYTEKETDKGLRSDVRARNTFGGHSVRLLVRALVNAEQQAEKGVFSGPMLDELRKVLVERAEAEKRRKHKKPDDAGKE